MKRTSLNQCQECPNNSKIIPFCGRYCDVPLTLARSLGYFHVSCKAWPLTIFHTSWCFRKCFSTASSWMEHSSSRTQSIPSYHQSVLSCLVFHCHIQPSKALLIGPPLGVIWITLYMDREDGVTTLYAHGRRWKSQQRNFLGNVFSLSLLEVTWSVFLELSPSPRWQTFICVFILLLKHWTLLIF